MIPLYILVMNKIERPILFRLLIQILRPGVFFAIKYSMRLQDFIECAKAVYVDLTQKELERHKVKPNVSKISVASGVHRRDVLRLEKHGIETSSERDLITKIIGQWRQDPRFTTKQGKPRVLSIGGLESEFAQLVASVSQDLNPGTVFFELCRIEAVQTSREGAKLLIQSFVPRGDPIAGFQIYGKDGEDLIRAVEHNVFEEDAIPHFHARTEYDSIRPEAITEIQRWMLKEGHEFHGRLRTFLSKFDQDINPDPKFKGKVARVVFSSFSFIDKK